MDLKTYLNRIRARNNVNEQISSRINLTADQIATQQVLANNLNSAMPQAITPLQLTDVAVLEML